MTITTKKLTLLLVAALVVLVAGLAVATFAFEAKDQQPLPHLRQYKAQTGYRDLLEYTLPDGVRCYKFLSTDGISCLAPPAPGAALRAEEGR